MATLSATAEGRPTMRRKASEVRSAILAAAREEFAEHGFGGATTREIAQRAKVNEVLIFRHFESKANLFNVTVFEPFSELLADFFESNPGAASHGVEFRRLFVQKLIVLLQDHRRLLLALIAAQAYQREPGRIPVLGGFFEHALAAVVASHVPNGDITADRAHLDRLIRCGFASVIGILLLEDWVFPDGFHSDAERAELLTRYIEYGMYGQPA